MSSSLTSPTIYLIDLILVFKKIIIKNQSDANPIGGKMELVLSKVIPQHRKTIKFNWCKKNFTTMSPRFRDIRRKDKDHVCFWCKHHFVDGEAIALAQPEEGLNKILCQACATELCGDKDIVYKETL